MSEQDAAKAKVRYELRSGRQPGHLIVEAERALAAAQLRQWAVREVLAESDNLAAQTGSDPK